MSMNGLTAKPPNQIMLSTLARMKSRFMVFPRGGSSSAPQRQGGQWPGAGGATIFWLGPCRLYSRSDIALAVE